MAARPTLFSEKFCEKGEIAIKEKEKEEEREKQKGKGPLVSLELAREAAELALSKKAEDVVILDLRDLSTVTDFFVICSGSSDTHVKAIADAVEDGLERKGARKWHIEGYTHKRWVLIDYVDVVVHVFHHKTREFYLLERLWGDAKIERCE